MSLEEKPDVCSFLPDLPLLTYFLAREVRQAGLRLLESLPRVLE